MGRGVGAWYTGGGSELLNKYLENQNKVDTTQTRRASPQIVRGNGGNAGTIYPSPRRGPADGYYSRYKPY